LTSIGSREGDESLHFARRPNFEFHARSIGPYLRDSRSRSGDIREHSPRRPSYTPEAVTREEFNARLHRGGGFRIHVRLIATEEGGRRTPITGTSEYRVNWSIESRDAHRQTGSPTLIDGDQLRPGEEGDASLIPFAPEEWSSVTVGTSLTAFEGARPVALAVVTQVIPPENEQPLG
jgi:hypothetical protein